MIILLDIANRIYKYILRFIGHVIRRGRESPHKVVTLASKRHRFCIFKTYPAGYRLSIRRIVEPLAVGNHAYNVLSPGGSIFFNHLPHGHFFGRFQALETIEK